LCTWGFALRAAIDAVAGGDPNALQTFSARFSGVVYPGDALTVRLIEADVDKTWRLDAAVGERGVLSNGVVTLR
jgi:acyl dehydratase